MLPSSAYDVVPIRQAIVSTRPVSVEPLTPSDSAMIELPVPYVALIRPGVRMPCAYVAACESASTAATGTPTSGPAMIVTGSVGRDDLGQGGGRHAEQLAESLRPPHRREIEQLGATGVAGLDAMVSGQCGDDPGVDGADGDLAVAAAATIGIDRVE